MFIWLSVIIAVMFIFFPKLLYTVLRAYIKNFRFTFPVTIGLFGGFLFYDFLKANDPSGFSKEAEFIAKPVFMIMLAGTLLKFVSDYFKEL